MKKNWILICSLLITGFLQAQTTLKANKSISRSDWNTYYTEFFVYAYGTASVLNDQGIAERLIGDKPVNPQDKVSWRPPPIPPTDNPDNPTGVKPVKTKTYKPRSVKPVPIDPGCNVCSVFVFPAGTKAEIIDKIRNVLQSYQ